MPPIGGQWLEMMAQQSRAQPTAVVEHVRRDLSESGCTGRIPHVHGLAIGQWPTQHLAGTGRIENEQLHRPIIGLACTLGMQRQALRAQISHQSAPIRFLLAGNGAAG